MRGRLRKAAVGVLALISASTALGETFNARLGRVPIDGRNQASVQGAGKAAAELDRNRLVVEGEFTGLVGPAISANLHMSPVVGVRGPVIHALEVTAMRDGKLSGTVDLDAEQVAALRAGRLYLQIHSESAPDGNLWGWLFDE
jgi:hypothetical protein